MVWMPNRCPVCKSDVIGNRCDNRENNGTPCWGMDAEQAALYSAREDFAADRISFDEMQERIEQALTDPPRRRFGVVLQVR